jgi:hypothetical protein
MTMRPETRRKPIAWIVSLLVGLALLTFVGIRSAPKAAGSAASAGRRNPGRRGAE